jgi:DNA processing protein
MKNKFYNPEFSNNQEEIISTIRLARTKNIGPITFRKLIDKYGSPGAALKASEQILSKKGEKVRELGDVEKEIENTEKCGAKIITIFDEHYPALLAEIADAPVTLSVKGDHRNLNNRSVAMVGARYSSANAVSLSYQLAKELAESDCVVTSGLARGIDTAAHKGALASKKSLPTIAVVAGGIDNIYPPENEKLFAEIAEKGVIISENEFGTVPRAEHFPRRNRIISGLSLVTLVVEAALKSGSLITARFAAEQNREVACIPGFPLDPRSEGTNMLIKRGANLITSSKDILELLSNYDSREIKTNHLFGENDEGILYDDKIEKEINIDLLEVISSSPTSVDEIMGLYGFSASEINSKLLEYEILGEIIRHPGNKVSKAA